MAVRTFWFLRMVWSILNMPLRPNVMSEKCASRVYFSIVASKWSLLVINALDDGQNRNGQLMRAVEGISQKVLTQTLRNLVDLGIVDRVDLETVPPHVTYCLTPLGKSLKAEVRSLIEWVETNMFQVPKT
jgi:DNA-binding HxlR family transcriptional regulator